MKVDSTQNTEYFSNMPPQYVSSSQKTDAWAIKCLKGLNSMANSTSSMRRTSRENKQANYDLVNSIFDPEDFDYVLNPYGLNASKYGGSATKMQNYNIIRSRLETLRGEEMNSSLDFFVYAVGGDAVSAKQQLRNDAIRQLMREQIQETLQLEEAITDLEQQMSQIQKEMQTVQDQQQLIDMQNQMQELQQQRNNMPDIQAEMKAFNSKLVHPVEQTNNKILQFLKRNDKLALKFNQGWFHALVAAEEVYYTGIDKGHPSVRAVNPLQLDYDKGVNTTFIHEGNWVREQYWLPASEVISRWGDKLTTEQVKRISKGQAGYVGFDKGMQEGFVYGFDKGQERSNYYQGDIASHCYVMQGSWRSSRKVGMLSYIDPRSGQAIETEVEDNFKLTPELREAGASIDWMWEDDIWEGTMIGDDIFVDMGPRANQTGNLPYVGYVYNNVNSQATSMVDLVKSHQYTYIITMWRLEQELAKAKGRKFIMDMAQLPKSMGWDVDKWLYYFEEMGVIWINSREEGRKGDPSTVAQFNQFNAIDMTLSQVVGQYMEILQKLEMMVEDIMGVSPQRMGDIGKSETATGAQTSISRSTNVTRPWFYFHDLVKEAVLSELLELAKIAYIDGTEIELFLSEFEIATLQVNGDDLNGSDMGVFVTNSFEDRVNREKMEQLLMSAVNQGKAELSDAAKVLESQSMNYTKSTLDAAEQRLVEREQAAQKEQSRIAEQQIQAANEKDQLDRAAKLEEIDKITDRELLLKKMDIASQGEGSGEVDAMVKLDEARRDDERLNLEREKEANRSKEKQEELDIKREDVKVKRLGINKKPSGPK